METKTFMAVRKPIYVVSIIADYKEYPTTYELVKTFKAKHPEYANCKEDTEIKDGAWHIHFYRECAEDFVEL